VASVVLDASALIAYLNEEPGADVVGEFIDDALISAVNLAEVLAKITEKVTSIELAGKIVNVVDIDIIDFDRRLAEDVAALVTRTKKFGLSLGDKACIALASRERLPALTADRAWARLDLDVEIKLIR
jgi:PIN domain nuclease of toxin-antitoxin system